VASDGSSVEASPGKPNQPSPNPALRIRPAPENSVLEVRVGRRVMAY